MNAVSCHRMKIHPIHILAAAFLATVQPSAYAVSAPPAVAQWEASLAAQEQRAGLLRDELKALDTRIEERIATIVGALRVIGDSKDSRTKVARMKEQTIEALKKNIGYYQNKRAALQEEMRRPTLRLAEEQKRKGIAVFDGHIALSGYLTTTKPAK
jgi:predicted  nucleic acid-binding Zn-ribbon protein